MCFIYKKKLNSKLFTKKYQSFINTVHDTDYGIKIKTIVVYSLGFKKVIILV